MADTFTGTVEDVDTREFAPYRPGAAATVQVQLRLIEPSGRLVCVETGAGSLTPRTRSFVPTQDVWPFLIESDGVPVSTLYIGDRVTIRATPKGPERVSRKTGKAYLVVNRAKIQAVLEHNGQRANGTQIGSLPVAPPVPAPVPARAPIRFRFSDSLGRDLGGCEAPDRRPVATIREVTPARQNRAMVEVERPDPGDEDPTCKHGNVIYRAGDCALCDAEDQEQAQREQDEAEVLWAPVRSLD